MQLGKGDGRDSGVDAILGIGHVTDAEDAILDRPVVTQRRGEQVAHVRVRRSSEAGEPGGPLEGPLAGADVASLSPDPTDPPDVLPGVLALEVVLQLGCRCQPQFAALDAPPLLLDRYGIGGASASPTPTSSVR